MFERGFVGKHVFIEKLQLEVLVGLRGLFEEYIVAPGDDIADAQHA